MVVVAAAAAAHCVFAIADWAQVRRDTWHGTDVTLSGTVPPLFRMHIVKNDYAGALGTIEYIESSIHGAEHDQAQEMCRTLRSVH